MRSIAHVVLALGASGLLAACGVLSGLDALEVLGSDAIDGGTDATSSPADSSDVAMSNEGAADASASADAEADAEAEADTATIKTDASADATAEADSQPPGPAVACGTSTCGGSNNCCVRTTPATRSCGASCNPSKEVAFACDTPDDCTGGQVCCGGAGLPVGSKVQCVSACAGIILCDLDGGKCADGAPCGASPISGYGACP